MSYEQIVGRWHLQSWTTRNTRGQTAYPFGENAQGSVIYTRGGWVSVHVASGQRPRMASDLGGAIGTEDQQLAAYSTYVAYSGTYRVQDNVISHIVTTSLYPNWVGIELRRFFDLSNDTLTLRMPPRHVSGDVLINELCWSRAE